MAGDPYKKVRPGDTLSIPATAYNAMLDAAVANRQTQAMGAGLGPGSVAATPTSTTVLIKNNSGVARNQFDVLGLDGALFDPATALESFKRQVVLKGVIPTSDHAGKFVVLQEPARVGSIARACLLGATVARVNVTTESMTYADVLASDATKLQTVSLGKAAIVWKQTGTGVKWAIVLLDAAASTSSFFAIIQSSSGVGNNQFAYIVRAAHHSVNRTWVVNTGATDLSVSNLNEVVNPTGGGTLLTLRPVVNGTVVLVHPTTMDSGQTAYWFSAPNDVICP
ncbi:MAG: hypothetical protein IT442_17585 [Phycisphaeraceae bacterium]|nr:hypothetical protein [Phycisphaeraceae bacterium]